MDLQPLGVPADAKVAIFEGQLIGTPSVSVNNTTVISMEFCAPSQNCDFNRPLTYTHIQGSQPPAWGPASAIAQGARSPATLHAAVEDGWIKYMWRTKYTNRAPDEYAGVTFTLRGFCR